MKIYAPDDRAWNVSSEARAALSFEVATGIWTMRVDSVSEWDGQALRPARISCGRAGAQGNAPIVAPHNNNNVRDRVTDRANRAGKGWGHRVEDGALVPDNA